MLCRIEIKNYRCFSDESPAIFELDDEFTAVVGPNNSGKSSLLRFFYELRILWSQIGSYGGFAKAISSAGISVNQILGVDDPAEIFNDANDRPITLDFEFPKVDGQVSITRVRLAASKPQWQNWKITQLM